MMDHLQRDVPATILVTDSSFYLLLKTPKGAYSIQFFSVNTSVGGPLFEITATGFAEIYAHLQKAFAEESE